MKCFYHNDLDGRCAGAIVAHFTKHKHPDDYFEVDYKNPLPVQSVDKCEVVFIVDYSFTEQTINQLEYLINKLHCQIIWIDHHESSVRLQNTPQYSWLKDIKGKRDTNVCGAALTYKWFKGKNSELPKFLQYVNDYDCWIYKFGDTTNWFKLGMDILPYKALDGVWEQLLENNNHSKNVLDKILDFGATIKDYIDIDNRTYLDNYGYESEIAGLSCLVINKRTNSWVFGDKINNYPIVMVWVFDGEKYQYSIYSNDDSVNCSEIAERYGGGGHKGAAGFISDRMMFPKTVQ